MFICICKAVTEKMLLETVQSGSRSMSEVQNACGAGSDCGACKPKLEKYISQQNADVTFESQAPDDSRDR